MEMPASAGSDEGAALAPTVAGIPQMMAPYLAGALPYLIAAKLALLLVLTWNTRFVMDEFVQLGQAKYLGHGFFDTIWPVKAVGYTVFYKLAHLLGWNATAILLIGRLQTFLLACAILAIAYACARALDATKPHALIVVLVLLSFSNFIEQIFRTRSEPLAVFFGLAALMVVLGRPGPTARRIVVAGLLSGLAFVTTQKSVYFNVALGLGLVADAFLAREFKLGLMRGVWLVVGWAIPLIVYCLAFGGTDPLPVAVNLFFGPADLVAEVTKAYPSLRGYVWQTLSRNALLYAVCFLAIAIEVTRLRRATPQRRIALVASLVVTLLVFAHNQPWPYVFVMALPFVALWIPTLLAAVSESPRAELLASAALALAVGLSFVRNVGYLELGNSEQLRVVARAERLLGPTERYFDGNGMIPNRAESSTLWLDVPLVIRTLHEGNRSEVYRIFADSPPKLVIWSYRMDSIEPVVGPLIRNSYVRVAPNIWLAGQRLPRGRAVIFDAPIAGDYRLYDAAGHAVSGHLRIGGRTVDSAIRLARGSHRLVLQSGPTQALLLPEGHYVGSFASGGDEPDLFAGVYR
jgi:hypothetical protein